MQCSAVCPEFVRHGYILSLLQPRWSVSLSVFVPHNSDLPTGWEEGYTFEGARCFIKWVSGSNLFSACLSIFFRPKADSWDQAHDGDSLSQILDDGHAGCSVLNTDTPIHHCHMAGHVRQMLMRARFSGELGPGLYTRQIYSIVITPLSTVILICS